MSASGLHRSATRRHHCRYYAAIAFTESLPPADQDGVQAALEETTVSGAGALGEEPVDPAAVTVAPEYALVEFTHAPAANHRAGYIAGRFSLAVGEWATQHGYYVEDLRAATEWGTLPSPPLSVAPGTDRVIERLERGLADADTPSAQHHYAIALPEREPTADERDVLTALAGDTDGVDVTAAGALVAFDPSPPRWDFAPLVRIQRRLGRTLPDETELSELAAWDYELGTLGRLDDTAREAVRQRASQQVPYQPTDADAAEEVNV